MMEPHSFADREVEKGLVIFGGKAVLFPTKILLRFLKTTYSKLIFFGEGPMREL